MESRRRKCLSWMCTVVPMEDALRQHVISVIYRDELESTVLKFPDKRGALSVLKSYEWTDHAVAYLNSTRQIAWKMSDRLKAGGWWRAAQHEEHELKFNDTMRRRLVRSRTRGRPEMDSLLKVVFENCLSACHFVAEEVEQEALERQLLLWFAGMGFAKLRKKRDPLRWGPTSLLWFTIEWGAIVYDRLNEFATQIQASDAKKAVKTLLSGPGRIPHRSPAQHLTAMRTAIAKKDIKPMVPPRAASPQ
jgi:hypothetical protein